MKATPDDCVHLNVDIVKEIHDLALEMYGGLAGVCDEGLLASAVAAPQASYDGKSVYAYLAEIAAAYLYYLCSNLAFVDGNRRTAMMSAILFLRLNGIEAMPDSDEWGALMVDVGASRLDRDQTTLRLRMLLKKRGRVSASEA